MSAATEATHASSHLPAAPAAAGAEASTEASLPEPDSSAAPHAEAATPPPSLSVFAKLEPNATACLHSPSSRALTPSPTVRDHSIGPLTPGSMPRSKQAKQDRSCVESGGKKKAYSSLGGPSGASSDRYMHAHCPVEVLPFCISLLPCSCACVQHLLQSCKALPVSHHNTGLSICIHVDMPVNSKYDLQPGGHTSVLGCAYQCSSVCTAQSSSHACLSRLIARITMGCKWAEGHWIIYLGFQFCLSLLCKAMTLLYCNCVTVVLCCMHSAVPSRAVSPMCCCQTQYTFMWGG